MYTSASLIFFLPSVGQLAQGTPSDGFFCRPTGKVARYLPLVAIFLFALNCDVLPLLMAKRDGADTDDLFLYPSDGKKSRRTGYLSILPWWMVKRDGADTDDLCFSYPSDCKKALTHLCTNHRAKKPSDGGRSLK